jgi:hypothetical protein
MPKEENKSLAHQVSNYIQNAVKNTIDDTIEDTKALADRAQKAMDNDKKD